MFDIGASELLIIAVVAILVIGPKDMPLALRTAGRWIGQIRKVSAHFRAGLDAMVREAELEEMEKKWQERNAQIMRDHPGEMTALPPAPPGDSSHDPDADDPVAGPNPSVSASAEARLEKNGGTMPADQSEHTSEPRLPLDQDPSTREGGA
jgi:sec-independent protein translocase protein TatB|tara:strand:- start:1438 stop:1890 length:453 start_codon:yes stop_codon:yes gene_type:complete